MQDKLLFIDRDGTLIQEPDDKQVDRLDKIKLLPQVIPSLLQLREAGYKFVMVTNQDGLGSPSFKEEDFYAPQNFILDIFSSQGITFEAVRICPHLPDAGCSCRKPAVGLLLDYFIANKVDNTCSYVIGDRDSDMQLAAALGLQGLRVNQEDQNSWLRVSQTILTTPRLATVQRKTNETSIHCHINLDATYPRRIKTGIDFFDHMLDQFALHAGISLNLFVEGDLAIDDHHTVEDTGIVLGEALRRALGDKRGITRYGFVLPMDDALASIALDLCGRHFLQFSADFPRSSIGQFSSEMVQHFFRSFSASLAAVLHIKVEGQNTHHMIEAIFKGVGRCVRQAVQIKDSQLPTTKGLL